MNVVVNGLMTNYQKVGKGKALVFLHGWGDDSGTFSQLIKQLQNKYTILSLDLPGFGGTQKPPNAWSLEDYSKFVAAWLKKIGATGIKAVIGHSFGGAVAITGLSNGEITTDRLVLLSSAGVRQKKALRREILWAGAKIGKIPLYLLPPNKATRMKKYLYGKAGSDLLLLPHMRQTFVITVREDLTRVAEQIKQPTLLVYGSKDRDTPVADGNVLNRAIPNSKLEVIEGAGHFLHQVQSEQLAKLVTDFLEEPA